MGLEAVHNCNARCIFCRFAHGTQSVENIFTDEKWVKQRKVMDWNLIEAIFQKHQPNIFILTGQGEPFLYPRIPDILKRGRKQPEDFTLSIFSNGNMMTEKVLDQIIPNPQFKSINFSINAATDETRMRVMGQPYKQAEENILMFLRKRREYGREKPFSNPNPSTDDLQDLRVGASFITVRENTHERAAFIERWTPIFREYHCNHDVGIFPAGNWGGAVPRGMLPQTMTHENPGGCGQWDCTAPTVDVDGQIMLCCYNSAYSFGSILDDEACEKWLKRRELFNVTRNQVYYPKTCQQCSHRFVPEGWDSA